MSVALTSSALWTHQERALEFVLPKRGAMLALTMGAGKTRVACNVILERGHKRTLITCPKSVLPVWKKEFIKIGSDLPIITLAAGSVAQKAAEVEAALKQHAKCAVVVNYEALREPAFLKLLQKGLFDLVIADESQRLQSPGSRTTRIFDRLGKLTPYRLALSGTPMANDPLDIYGQYKFLDRSIFGTSFAEFRNRYAVLDPGAPYPKILRYQNLIELNEKFYSIAYRVGAEALDLPDSTHTARYCVLSPQARRVYKELEKQFYSEIETGQITISNALVKILRLQQITGGNIKLDAGIYEEIDKSKSELLEEVLLEIDQDEPIAVFGKFTPDLRNIAQAAHKAGRTYGELSGQRNDLAKWQQGDLNVLGVQIASGSEGIDLTRSKYAIYYSLSHSLAQFDQSKARIHRPGQTRNTIYVHLIAENSIDQRIYKALEAKQDVIESILQMEK